MEHLEKIFQDIGDYSMIAFPDAGAKEHLVKLIHEATETIEKPQDLSEYADCLLCLFAAAYKAGFTYNGLVKAVNEKFEIVKTRKWEKLPDGTYQHINP